MFFFHNSLYICTLLIPTGNRLPPCRKVESVGKKWHTNLSWREIYFCRDFININSNQKKKKHTIHPTHLVLFYT